MNELTPKTFWQKPEGKTGAILLIALVIGGGYVFYHALPTLLVLMENTLYLVLMGIALAAILYVIFDPKFRTIIWYFYQMLMRTLTGVVIQLDPIKILESYITYLYKSLEKVDEQIGNLKKEISKLKGNIERNAAEIEGELKIASAAKSKGDNLALATHGRQADRLKHSNESLSEIYNKLTSVYQMLLKVRENANFLLVDTENEVKTRKIEYNSIKAGHSAFKSAMKVIKGDDDLLAVFNQSMEFVVDDVRAKVGEIEYFMTISTDALKNVDLQNAVFEADGFKLLEEWEKNNNIIREGTTTSLNSKPKNSYSDMF